MTDSPTTRLNGNGNGRETKIPASAMAAIISALVAGGGVGVGSWSVRESLVRLEGAVQALRDEVRPAIQKADSKLEALDTRLRAVELEQARSRPPR